MKDAEDSDAIPLDGVPDLTPAERLAFRKWLRDQEHARWVGRKLKVWVPIVGSALYGLWHGAIWLKDHVIFK